MNIQVYLTTHINISVFKLSLFKKHYTNQDVLRLMTILRSKQSVVHIYIYKYILLISCLLI